MDTAKFFSAIASGKTKKVREFVSKQPVQWQTMVTKDGFSAIAFAISCNSLEVAEYFLSTGLDIESRVDMKGATAFLHAAYKGSLKGVDLLLRNGCNVHVKDDDGNGVLALACLGSDLMMVKRICTMGFSVNATHQNSGFSIG
ncbi:myotrophin-like [Oscarella lobularis]|uniref:myotrophin-like n=1 Tax=Oscarella lobularis TaxID=121494 RepID=UPI0033133272